MPLQLSPSGECAMTTVTREDEAATTTSRVNNDYDTTSTLLKLASYLRVLSRLSSLIPARQPGRLQTSKFAIPSLILQDMLRRGTSSPLAPSSASSAGLPVSSGRVRSQKRRIKNTRPAVMKRLVQVLLLVVCGFCLVDLYYLLNVTKHHKLAELRPAFREQQEKVKQVWKQEKEELSELSDMLLRRRRNPEAAAQVKKEDPVGEAKEDNHDPEHEASEEEVDHEMFHADPRGQHDHKGVDDDDDHDVDHDKEEIYEILEQAGVARHELDVETRRKLPTWSKVQELYGTHPLIYGLERCHDFTDHIEPSTSFFGIAGVFNSGTNLLAELLIQNCQITKRMKVFGEDQKGMRWQVPWGKHTPVSYREQHVTDTDSDVPVQNSFPMLTIRDPYRWMRSMCKHIYGARWPHNRTACPHVWMEEQNQPSPVRVKYSATIVSHKSLPDFWNDWYNDYLAADFPRILVRFEDLLFYGKNVTQTLCKCGGGDPRRDHFVHVKTSAKLGTAAHGANKTNLIDAIIQFGSEKGRLMGMTPNDIKYSKKLLDPKLMDMFQYPYAELSDLETQF